MTVGRSNCATKQQAANVESNLRVSEDKRDDRVDGAER